MIVVQENLCVRTESWGLAGFSRIFAYRPK